MVSTSTTYTVSKSGTYLVAANGTFCSQDGSRYTSFSINKNGVNVSSKSIFASDSSSYGGIAAGYATFAMINAANNDVISITANNLSGTWGIQIYRFS